MTLYGRDDLERDNPYPVRLGGDGGQCNASGEMGARASRQLLEVTHGQWLYRNVHAHDAASGIAATARKERIEQFIEDQIELGGEDWTRRIIIF